jgi:uncharacterized protein (TIGR03083 family)
MTPPQPVVDAADLLEDQECSRGERHRSLDQLAREGEEIGFVRGHGGAAAAPATLPAVMSADDVLAAASTCTGLLGQAVDRDWTAEVPGLDFTVASVLAHAAECALWYAVDLWGGPDDDTAFELGVRPDAANQAVLTSVRSASAVCAAAVRAAPPGLRGFHPYGSPDPSGFAAMACDELLVHGDDAARGLGLRLTPDADLAARLLARLFPWHEAGTDPWQTLLWANGRIELPGRPAQPVWRWHCAPPAEWDGTIPGAG